MDKALVWLLFSAVCSSTLLSILAGEFYWKLTQARTEISKLKDELTELMHPDFGSHWEDLREEHVKSKKRIEIVEAELQGICDTLPSSYYADRPQMERVAFMVRHWRKLVPICDDLQEECDKLREELALWHQKSNDKQRLVDEVNHAYDVHNQMQNIEAGLRKENAVLRKTCEALRREIDGE